MPLQTGHIPASHRASPARPRRVRQIVDRARSAGVVLSCFCALALVPVSGRMHAVKQKNGAEASWKSAPLVTRLNARSVQSMAFGLTPMLVDYFWVRLLQDEEGEAKKPAVNQRSVPAVLMHLISDIDPANFEAYTWGSIFLSVLRDEAQEAVSLMLKGRDFVDRALPSYPEEFKRRFWSESFFIPFRQAYLYLFEVEDIQKAAEAYRAASRYENAPEYIKGIVKKFDTQDGLYTVGLQTLEHTAKGALDPAVVEKLKRKYAVLAWKQALFNWNREFEKSPYSKKRDLNGFLKSKGIAPLDPDREPVYLSETGRITSKMDQIKVMGL